MGECLTSLSGCPTASTSRTGFTEMAPVADGELHHVGDDGSAGLGCRGADPILDLGSHGVHTLCGGFADAGSPRAGRMRF